MNEKIINEYINEDMINPAKYKNQVSFSGVVVFLGLWASVISQSFYIFPLMLLLFIVSLIVVLKVKSSQLTLKKKLIIQTIIYFNWFLQFELLATMFFVYEFGWNFGVVLLYLPAILISITLCIVKAQNLKKGGKSKTFPWAIFATVPVALGIFGGLRSGKALNEVLKTLSTRSYTIVMISILVIISCFFSIGAYNIQKLYYLRKYNIMLLK